MAIITDLDNLTINTDIIFNTTAKTIQLIAGTVGGQLTTDGVTLKAVYSFCKEEWKSSNELIKHAFPFTPITDEQFEIKDGWDFADAATRKLIRSGGWATVDGAGQPQEMYAGIVTLGSLEDGTQAYYSQSADATGSSTNFSRTDSVNEAILIKDTFNDYSTSLKLFAREQGGKFAQSTLSDIGVEGGMTYQVYRFPLATSADLKIEKGDTIIDAAPFNGITISYLPEFNETINGQTYQFNVKIDGQNQSIEAIYERLQFQLRQTTNINDDPSLGADDVNGNITGELAFFLGDTLKLREGIYLENFSAADTNRIIHDPLGAHKDITFPFTASLRVNFGANLKGDTDAIYHVFFAEDFGTTNAITVQDKAGAVMKGSAAGLSHVDLSYDYTANVQRGEISKETDANITVVGLGLTSGQYVSATGVIAQSTSNVVTLVSALERNYSNPD